LARDQRSVGELLLDADITARSMMADLDTQQVPGMLRAWPGTVRAAGAFWDALPTDANWQPGRQHIPDPPLRSHLRQLTAQTAALEHAFHSDFSGHEIREPWPLPGDPDERLTRITEDLQQAATMVTRNSARIIRSGTWTPRQTADLQAACTRVMHTLYVCAHAVATTCEDFAAEEQRRIGDKPNINGKDLKPGARASRMGDRLRQIERIAEPGVHGQTSRHAQRHDDSPGGLDRLRHAVSEWGTATARLGEDDLTTGRMRWVSRVDGAVTAATAMLSQAGQATGEFSEDLVEPLMAGLQASHRQWAGIERTAGQITDMSDVPPPEEVHAGNELLAALRELTWDGTAQASPTTLSERVDLTQAVGVLRVSLGHATFHAQDLQHAAASRRVLAHARPIQEDLKRSVKKGTTVEREYAPVSPDEIRRNDLRHVLGYQSEKLSGVLYELPQSNARVESRIGRMIPVAGRGYGVAETLGADSPEASRKRRDRLDRLLSSPVPLDKPGGQTIPAASNLLKEATRHLQEADQRSRQTQTAIGQLRGKLANAEHRDETGPSRRRDDRSRAGIEQSAPHLK